MTLEERQAAIEAHLDTLTTAHGLLVDAQDSEGDEAQALIAEAREILEGLVRELRELERNGL